MKKIMLKDMRACWFGVLPPEEEVTAGRSIRHLLRPVPVSPLAHAVEQRDQGPPGLREGILDLGRNLRIHLPVHQAVVLQLLQYRTPRWR